MMDLIGRLLAWLRSPGEGIGQRVLHGGIWATLLNVADRGLNILRLVILANLLAPSQFGVLGIALLTMAVLRQLANLGIEPAIVQRKESNVDRYLDTAWVLMVGRGVLLFGLLFVAAPIVAGFFDTPSATDVLRVLGVTLILIGFENPGVIYLQKDLEFHREFVHRFSGTVVNVAVAVTYALLYGTVWALVAGIVAGRAVRLVVSYSVHEYRPNLTFELDRAREIISFGKWMWGVGILTFLATSGDDAFVGWFLTASALGLYQMAFRLSNAPATEVSQVLSRVLFPAYAQIQNDIDVLRGAFRRSIRFVLLLTVPMSAGIILVARPFTRLVLGGEWVPMVEVMQIMAIAGLLRAVAATGGALFKGYGEPEWSFAMNVLRVAVIAVTIWPLTARWGITGAGASITLGVATTIPVWAYRSAGITGLEWREYATAISIPLIGAGGMSLCVLAIPVSSLFTMGLAVLVGLVTYPLVVIPLYRSAGFDPISNVLKLGG